MYNRLIILLICVLLLIILIYNMSFLNYNYFKINSLLKTRQLKEIKYRYDLMDYPLCEFMINSSHNSYLNSIQHFSFASTTGIKFALEAGARCIELDIHERNNMPVVAHGDEKHLTTTYIKLEKAIDCILENGFKTSDPLFIFIEIPNLHQNNINQQIKDLFINKFGNKLYVPSTNYEYIPIKQFINKVVLLGKVDNKYILSDIITRYNPDNNNPDKSIISNQNNNFTRLSRVYPDPTFWTVLSYNIDFNLCKNYKNNMICMNFQGRDKSLFDNLTFFKDYSFIHKSEIN